MESNISQLLNGIDGVEKINEIIDKLGITTQETKEKVKVLLGEDKIKTDLLKRCACKLIKISEKVGKSSIITIIGLIKNKEKFLDIIDSCDDVKMSELINYSDPIKLAYYINTNKRQQITDEIRQSQRDKMQKLAKNINKIKIPKISKEKIF